MAISRAFRYRPFHATNGEVYEEAAQVGKLIAESRFTRKKDKHE